MSALFCTEKNSFGVYRKYMLGLPTITPDETFTLSSLSDSISIAHNPADSRSNAFWWSSFGSSTIKTLTNTTLSNPSNNYFAPFLNPSTFLLCHGTITFPVPSRMRMSTNLSTTLFCMMISNHLTLQVLFRLLVKQNGWIWMMNHWKFLWNPTSHNNYHSKQKMDGSKQVYPYLCHVMVLNSSQKKTHHNLWSMEYGTDNLSRLSS